MPTRTPVGGERAETVDRARNDAGPEVADRELAVEVAVDVGTQARLVGNAALRDVGVEVLAPTRSSSRARLRSRP